MLGVRLWSKRGISHGQLGLGKLPRARGAWAAIVKMIFLLFHFFITEVFKVTLQGKHRREKASRQKE